MFSLYLAVNMGVCALLFAPWVYPRETVSGFIGRVAVNGRGTSRVVAQIAAAMIDNLHRWEPDHCYVTYRLEDEFRRRAY